MAEPHPIRRYRDANGMTQAQFAELIGEGVTHVQVSRWENRQREPDGRELLKISELIGVPVEEIVRASLATPVEGVSQ